jgi:predicted DNA-binding WGR domain protein
VQVLPTLFGDWTVLREWGRRGSPGTVRLSSYQRRNEAETVEQRTIKRRRQHGYKAICLPRSEKTGSNTSSRNATKS